VVELKGQLSRERDVDLKGRSWHPWLRRGLLLAVFVFALAALLNAFGQAPTKSSATAPAATLSVEAPQKLRGGLIFEGEFVVDATQKLEHPTLILSGGWLDGITLNTIEPAPESETSRQHELHLRFATLPAGERLTVWTQWQVNPVNVGTQPQNVALYDGTEPVASVERDVTVLP
jgi:hypothetical protein